MRISVILSTYNKPHFLERVLWGYAVQTDRDFELVIADDGSTGETAETIRRVCAENGLHGAHVWHEDRGFRKTEILNQAIRAASGDYLLFSDGDCIPRHDLIAVHRFHAEPGRYLAGGYLKLCQKVSEAIRVEDIVAGRVTDLAWLRAQGWRPGRNALRLLGAGRIGALLDFLTPTAAHFNGNNVSVWRDALVAVNGFERDMGYGGSDRATGYRLDNLGLRGKQLRHRAVCMHLHHDRPYRDPEMIRQNRAIMDGIRRTGATRARSGLAELQENATVERIAGRLRIHA
jgi:glycosyltransferase involved in cell wall biosynthesis